MSENVILALVAFFSAVVTFATAVFGYLKIYRKADGFVDAADVKIASYEERYLRYEQIITAHEKRIALLETRLENLMAENLVLKQQNYQLMQELREAKK